MHALILIDQQKGLDNPKLGQRNNPGAEAVMRQLLSLWRREGWPVIHVKHRSSEPDSVFWPEQSGFAFKDDFLPMANEPIIEKTVPCAFIHSRLEATLAHLAIRNLVIVGAATHNSVEATARTGGNLGYQVYVIEDACFTYAKHDYFGNARSAEDVHAMSLANLQGEYATVLASNQFLPLMNIRC